MKYEYGKEYKMNGEKPDLPGWVEVEWWNKHRKNWTNMTTVDLLNWAGNEINPPVEKFRIVDERWKPKPNWHERGELPPVGEVVEYSCLYRDGKESIELGQWYSGKIIAYHDDFVWTSDNGLRMISNTKFRPLPTERDVLVERAEMDIHQKHSDMIARHHIQALIDAGWRPIKQQSEAEFVDYGYGAFSHPEAARKAYRAGCRFVERGES